MSVLVPTWQRHESLQRCILALVRQERPPTQIVVSFRDDDDATRLVLRDFPGVRAVVVPAGTNLVASMNAGLSETTGDFVALTDDDSEPRTDWLARMLPYFDDAKIGGVGGRDWQPQERGSVTGEHAVGRASWYGRVTSNHHLGAGPARDVDVLKGVNCCFRRDLLHQVRFDRRLRGSGNVSHWELSLCLAIRRAGWRLIYDPAIRTTHHIAVRHDGDTNARGIFARDSHIDGVHNETLATLEHLSPLEGLAFSAWYSLIGTRASPGLAQVARLGLRRGRWAHEWERFLATQYGRREGGKTFRRYACQLRPEIPQPPRAS